MRSEPHHSRLITALIAVMALVLTLGSPAGAQQPGGPPTEPPNEGGSQTLATLRENLAAAGAGYIEAEARLDAAKAQQALFEAQLVRAEADMVKIKAGVGQYAKRAYQTGRLGVIGTMLNASSTNEALLTLRDVLFMRAMVSVHPQALRCMDGIGLERM